MVKKIVDIIVERRGYILLVKKGDFWILPGGEYEDGCELASLEAIVAREMNDQVAGIFNKLENTIRGISPVRGGEVEVTVYVGDISSEKMSDVRDCNAHWFSRESIQALRLSNITRAVLDYYFLLAPTP